MNTIFTNEPTITPEIIESHGLTAEEYQHILDRIQRPPNLTELGIFSAMWNEHCSYKSSKKWLRMLPCSGPHVLQGPGENAGVVDIGDGECVVFKMESHNHPSMIEPFQGAATGTGGILRDIFTMGARPIAVMNALRFGSPKHPRTKELVSGVVAGIGAYANAFGVPTTGGELNFHPDYNENCLVNAFAAGITKTESIFYSKPTGPGLPLIYLGAKTGRDGIGGATMASAEFDTENQDDKTSVQVADPFKAKCLLEACLELMETGAVIALQDMGAAGLTCSCVEMGAKGDLGIELNLDFVPLREESMSAYEIMLSESQERMLLVLHPEKKEEAQAIFLKWGLDCAIIGQTTEDKILKIFYKGKKVVHLPIQDLTEQAPEYDRPFLSPKKPEPIKDTISECDPASTLLFLIGSQHLSSRRWVWEQYDTYIGGNCLQKPGGNAGVIRVGSHTKKALAFSSDCTPRYCKADPYEGAKQAVAECWRNLTATGALPLAATDNLNFGNPERSEIMGQFSEAIKGISEACLALNFPIVSGNVSLYNETNGRGIPPTPVIAGVGLIKDCSKMVSLAFQGDEENILLLGAPEIWGTHLEQSIYMQECCSYFDGPPPPVDLIHEKKIGHFVRACLEEGLFTAVHDLSDGGLAVALAEMTLASNRGALINQPEGSITKAFFGEDQGRYLVTIKPKNIEKIQEMASLKGISSSLIGTTGGETLKLGNAPAISIAALKEAYESWFPTFMRF